MIELRNELNQVYFKADVVTEDKYLKIEWEGYAVTLAEIMTGLNTEIRLCKEHHLTAMLSDHTKVYGSWAHANEWIEQFAVPELIAAGVKKYAQVLSKDTFAQLSSDELKLIFEKSFTVKFFKDPALAQQWIVE